MNRIKIAIFLSVICIIDITFAQRGFYSGPRPQGYKDNFVPKIETTINNRFDGQSQGQPVVNTPNGRVPVNANNDIYLVNYLASLPREKQPFWFINYQQLEAQRGLPSPGFTQTQTQGASTQVGSRSPFAGNIGSQNGVRTSGNSFGQNTAVSSRFDGSSGVYQPQVPEGPRLGPFKVVVGVPASNTNNLF